MYHRVSMTKAHTLEIATCSLFAHYQVTCIMPNLLFILSYSCNNAQCLYQKWKLEIQVRFPLQHPFFPGIFISDKLIVDWPLPSFTFDIYLGTIWTLPTADEWFTIESVSTYGISSYMQLLSLLFLTSPCTFWIYRVFGHFNSKGRVPKKKLLF